MTDGYDIDFTDFEIETDIDTDDVFEFETRYMKPKYTKDINPKFIQYRYAVQLARAIKLMPNERIYAIVNGSFIFGDLIEALLVEKNIQVKEMVISTLSMNPNNIDSLANLLNGGYLDKLTLIVSEYFFAHERHDLIPYIFETLDVNDKFQLVTTRSHCKICMFETYNEQYIVMHGSANLRSSGNTEQLQIENSKELYEFNYNYHKKIIDRGKIINHNINKR